MKASVKKILQLLKTDSSNHLENSEPIKDPQTATDSLQIEITHKESSEQDNVTEFWFRPDQPIKLQKVAINIENDEDVINSDPTIDYKENQWHLLAGYEDVQAGDNWKFTFVYSLIGQGEDSSISIQYKI